MNEKILSFEDVQIYNQPFTNYFRLVHREYVFMSNRVDPKLKKVIFNCPYNGRQNCRVRIHVESSKIKKIGEHTHADCAFTTLFYLKNFSAMSKTKPSAGNLLETIRYVQNMMPTNRNVARECQEWSLKTLAIPAQPFQLISHEKLLEMTSGKLPIKELSSSQSSPSFNHTCNVLTYETSIHRQEGDKANGSVVFIDLTAEDSE